MTLFLQFNPDLETYDIMVHSAGMSPMPAGARLFHPDAAVQIPDIKFSHATAKEAGEDMRKLRAYLAALPAKKPGKKDGREVGV